MQVEQRIDKVGLSHVDRAARHELLQDQQARIGVEQLLFRCRPTGLDAQSVGETSSLVPAHPILGVDLPLEHVSPAMRIFDRRCPRLSSGQWLQDSEALAGNVGQQLDSLRRADRTTLDEVVHQLFAVIPDQRERKKDASSSSSEGNSDVCSKARPRARSCSSSDDEGRDLDQLSFATRGLAAVALRRFEMLTGRGVIAELSGEHGEDGEGDCAHVDYAAVCSAIRRRSRSTKRSMIGRMLARIDSSSVAVGFHGMVVEVVFVIAGLLAVVMCAMCASPLTCP